MRLEKTVLFAIGIYWVTSVTGVQDAIAASGTKLLATELSITRLQYEGGGDRRPYPYSIHTSNQSTVESSIRLLLFHSC